jgi:cytochrome c556
MMKKVLASIAFAAMLGLTASASLGGPIEDRQELMKANGKMMKLLGGMAQGENPFDAAVVKQEAEAMAARFEKAKTLFPPGSDQGPPETFAKPEIWTDPEGFASALNRAVEASRTLAGVTEAAQLGEAVETTGSACKNCHEKFSRPKD